MAEISLSDVITDAVSAYLADSEEPAMLNGFVFVCSTVNSDGSPNLRITSPDTQGYHQTLGLVGFAEECTRHDIREALYEGME